jgi:hypothetical protein
LVKSKEHVTFVDFAGPRVTGGKVVTPKKNRGGKERVRLSWDEQE